ncbi:hypothetical protein DH2020_000619 [Rehmannia glutinosa]|uniref:15-cis-phytoene synthase n=1 Tax=Rehmannia glutinosa TaxID=99300 RepID=A0ABR0XXF9_REHGL
MNAAFSCSAKPYIKTSLLSKYRKTSARIEMAIAIPKRNKDFSKTELSVHGIPCTDLFVHEIVQRQSEKFDSTTLDVCAIKPNFDPMFLEEAYKRCRDICAEYAKTFYLGTLLMTEERQKAIWAIYVWCRRTDELVDGPNAVYLSSAVLDRWEERLDDIFDGRPYDMLDAALTHTVHKFPLDIKPFKDMIEGMRMDTRKNRYANFEELYLYFATMWAESLANECSRMGIALNHHFLLKPSIMQHLFGNWKSTYKHSKRCWRRRRVYLPKMNQKFGLCDKDVFSRKVTDGWREFMKEQIKRARFYFNQAEEGATQLHKASRWPPIHVGFVYAKYSRWDRGPLRDSLGNLSTALDNCHWDVRGGLIASLMTRRGLIDLRLRLRFGKLSIYMMLILFVVHHIALKKAIDELTLASKIE